ncbi:MAG TPA: DUF177 domain-containing protein [Pyrinomonadaceae bacterium]|nr:DUF177 domain-containing protein [Pyrinomonadaceae bacterium]
MLIDINKIDETVGKIKAEFQPGEIESEDELLVLKDKIVFEGSLEKHIYRIDIAGSIKTKAEISCSRCLKPMESDIDISFKSSFVPAEFETREKEVEVGGDDLNIEFYEGDEIDLAQLIREQIILNSPQIALCKPDCAGLCEKCGGNKNEKRCDCSEREIDPRLKVLENLTREKKD